MIAIPAIALPFIIRAAVVKGVATATEVSTIGIVYSALAGLLIYRQFGMAAPIPDADRYCGAFGRDLAHYRCGNWNGVGFDPVRLLGFAGKVHDRIARGVPIFLAVSIVTFVILGSVLEGIPAIVLFGPLLPDRPPGRGSRRPPLCDGRCSCDGEFGLFAPPFGVGYYAPARDQPHQPTKA